MCAAAVASIFIEGSRVRLQQHTDTKPSKNLALSCSLYVHSHAALEVCTSLLLLLLLEMPHIIFELSAGFSTGVVMRKVGFSDSSV